MSDSPSHMRTTPLSVREFGIKSAFFEPLIENFLPPSRRSLTPSSLLPALIIGNVQADFCGIHPMFMSRSTDVGTPQLSAKAWTCSSSQPMTHCLARMANTSLCSGSGSMTLRLGTSFIHSSVIFRTWR